MSKKRKQRVIITDKHIDCVLDAIERGMPASRACEFCGISYSGFNDRRKNSVDLNERYNAARLWQLHKNIDDVYEIERRVLNGEIEPNVFRVYIRSLFWRLEKLHPHIAGKAKVKVSGKIDIAQLISVSRHQQR